jgi:sugar fermentation stimulation protein A
MDDIVNVNRRKIRDVVIDFPELHPAELIKRENRFRVKIQLGKEITSAHLANPGRLQELLIPGANIWVSESHNPKRRTAFSIELVRNRNTLVSVNSQLPNALVNIALMNHTLPNLANYQQYKREVQLGRSRIDFCISHDTTLTWLEVKSVTLVRNEIAAFPDAPTLRGQRHLSELMEVTRSGAKSIVLFVVQRDDAKAFTPNDATDQQFGQLLRNAAKVGTEIYAIGCRVTTENIKLGHFLPVHI